MAPQAPANPPMTFEQMLEQRFQHPDEFITWHDRLLTFLHQEGLLYLLQQDTPPQLGLNITEDQRAVYCKYHLDRQKVKTLFLANMPLHLFKRHHDQSPYLINLYLPCDIEGWRADLELEAEAGIGAVQAAAAERAAEELEAAAEDAAVEAKAAAPAAAPEAAAPESSRKRKRGGEEEEGRGRKKKEEAGEA